MVFVVQSGEEVFMTDFVVNLGEGEGCAIVDDVGCLFPDGMTMHEGFQYGCRSELGSVVDGRVVLSCNGSFQTAMGFDDPHIMFCRMDGRFEYERGGLDWR